ncbi:hypothetical protein [Azospirillum endophyticum]
MTVSAIAEPLSDEALADRLLSEPQALCIVNSRRHARDLHQRIAVAEGARHLSTCLCAKHRRAELAAIRQNIKDGKTVRLVSTSLVEAGVDFSFPVVYRAMAGLDSIAQAAGRCNRNGELPELGRVLVFESPEDEDHWPPAELAQFAQTAASVLRAHDDPLALDTLRAYFRQVYWLRGDEDLDAALVGEGQDAIRGILNALRLHRRKHDLPFADIAKAFRIVESPLVPVIVPYRPAGEPDAVPRRAAPWPRVLEIVPETDFLFLCYSDPRLADPAGPRLPSPFARRCGPRVDARGRGFPSCRLSGLQSLSGVR